MRVGAMVSPTVSESAASRRRIVESAAPSARRSYAAAAWTVLLACSAGMVMQQVDGKPAPVARPHAVTRHATAANPDPPRILALQGTVESYDPSQGMLELASGGSSYRVRISHAVAARTACAARPRLESGSTVRMTFAAYLDGPLIALTVLPTGARGPINCTKP